MSYKKPKYLVEKPLIECRICGKFEHYAKQCCYKNHGIGKPNRISQLLEDVEELSVNLSSSV